MFDAESFIQTWIMTNYQPDITILREIISQSLEDAQVGYSSENTFAIICGISIIFEISMILEISKIFEISLILEILMIFDGRTYI